MKYSLCSAHPYHVENCAACNASTEDIDGWEEAEAEAKAAGLHTCKCGFEYYKTVDSCPLCNLKR